MPIESNRWLVIDEFNRAEIDHCFGELFSVLAGDTVELPFEETTRNESNDEQSAFVRILAAKEENDKEISSNDAESMFRDYKVSPEFRLIGTMNDADRSRLHQLSFALQRRFDLLRVEAPDVTLHMQPPLASK